MSTETTVEEHGTPAAYQRHRKRGEDACADCLRGNAEYTQQWRAANPDYRQHAKRIEAVRRRALAALADERPDDFRRIYDQAIRDEFGIGS